MAYNRPTDKDAERQERATLKLILIAVAIGCAVIAGIWWLASWQLAVRDQKRQDEIARWEAHQRQVEAELAEKRRLDEIEYQRQRQIADSIRIANMPSYSIEDVHEMVRTVAPSYSWVHLWRMDNDNWIMKYKKEYGDKEHWFIQRFNPTTRKFEKAIEHTTVYYRSLTDIDGVFTHPKNPRCSFTEDNRWGTLDYYEDGKHIGVYSRDGIEHDCRLPSKGIGPLTKKRIKARDSAPPEWVEEGYESVEDYYYDNEDDLYFYYNR